MVKMQKYRNVSGEKAYILDYNKFYSTKVTVDRFCVCVFFNKLFMNMQTIHTHVNTHIHTHYNTCIDLWELI